MAASSNVRKFTIFRDIFPYGNVVINLRKQVFRNAVVAALIGSTALINYQSVRAEIDYDGVKYLGGGDKVDLNNANIRAYLKIPGLYPTIASKLVNNGPYKSVQDVFNIASLSSSEKETLKNSESRFIVLEGKPEYVIDKINNG